jgi:hypothetical protein
MDLPHRYPCNPQLRIIGFLLAAGGGILALVAFNAPSWICVPIGTFLMLGGLGLTVRRFALPRFLELGQDAMLLPTGLFRTRIAKIAYADIESTEEFKSARTASLKLRTKGHTFEIPSIMMADMADYVAVRDFLNSLPGPKEMAASRQNQPIERGKYCFQCTYEGNGTIYDSKGEIVWQVKTQHSDNRPHYPHGFFRLPDFVVYDKTDKELIRVRLERRLPLARFVMFESGVQVCRIRQRSILLNKYGLDFADHSKWMFHMPLFSVIFRGRSETGARIRVRLRTHNLWYVLIDSDADSLRLVAALAFIHRERLRCN